MLLIQFSIGALNDVMDVDLDAAVKPGKPIPAGYLTRRVAAAIAAISALAGLVLSAVFGPAVLLLALAMYGCGVAYDLFLKRGPWGWVAYAAAFPLLPVYAWWAVAGTLPPRYELLGPLAILAGPVLQLANGIVDLERDTAAGVRSAAVLLGKSRTLLVMRGLGLLILTLAWFTLAIDARTPLPAFLVIGLGTTLGAAGAKLSGSPSPSRRERGWEMQTSALALLATAWLVAALA